MTDILTKLRAELAEEQQFDGVDLQYLRKLIAVVERCELLKMCAEHEHAAKDILQTIGETI